MNTSRPRIVILGMGVCGLGAAWRLQQLGYDNFCVFERRSRPGGLADSIVDDQGFTWDIGGHVQFSHYGYFDQLMDDLMGDDWLYHDRSAWVWMRDRFIPYPFQYNIRRLPQRELLECLAGLIDLRKSSFQEPHNFREWILATFGKGIAESFMFPYNRKVWACPPEEMSYGWIGERVAVTDLKRVVHNILAKKDDISWGPNNRFRFPLAGGTGEIWRRLFRRLDPGKMFLDHEVVEVNTGKRFVTFRNGRTQPYDILISTAPLDRLIAMSDLPDKRATNALQHSSVHVVGVGIRGSVPEHLRTRSWMYFPEGNSPFYRATVFSNYSPQNVPVPGRYWSLMAEVSESTNKIVDHATVVEDVLQGMQNTKLLPDRQEVTDVWHHFEPYGYPVPSLHRDRSLTVLKDLEKWDIYSRGRFGGWKYEVSNQDHSLMQGVELINRLILNEEELTLWNPHAANRGNR